MGAFIVLRILLKIKCRLKNNKPANIYALLKWDIGVNVVEKAKTSFRPNIKTRES